MNEHFLTPARRPILDELTPLSTSALKRRWFDVTGALLPKFLRREFILLALMHALDEQASGGSDIALRRELNALADQIEPGRTAQVEAKPPRKLRAGTRLLREWKGTVEEVTVTKDGFVWRGTTHASLSHIARAITGTRWNGWVFFGVAKKTDGKVAAKTARRSIARRRSASVKADGAHV